ncbi:SDR family NAD(P)-dependent oxidoreductase [Pseudahrensia aquimaris]|uniref:SDR family NAD(P)-dependent oxidoreductase n=1 Tax=Pseudahrensia aquimaris TaxID=744461 RepID=A0ABW3FCG1_9HYPH
MRVLITGAVEGLGRALAEQLLSEGHTVVAVDRNRTGLHELTQSHVGLCESRLVDMEDKGVLRLLAEEPGTLPYDLVILNAGISATGKFEEIPSDAYRRLINVNLRAPLLLASSFVANGKMAAKSKIIFISSLSHAVGYPGASVYAATKDGIAIYAKSARKPFKKKGVSVMTVFPGPIRTAHAEKHAPPGAKADKRMDPEKLAKSILRAAKTKRSELYPGIAASFAGMAGRFAPNMATKAMRRAIFDKLQEPKY